MKTKTREGVHLTADEVARIEQKLKELGGAQSEDGSGWHFSTLGGVRPLGECVVWMLGALRPDAGADAGEHWRRGNVGMRCVVMSERGIICDTGRIDGSDPTAIELAERIIRAHYVATHALALRDLIASVQQIGPGMAV